MKENMSKLLCRKQFVVFHDQVFDGTAHSYQKHPKTWVFNNNYPHSDSKLTGASGKREITDYHMDQLKYSLDHKLHSVHLQSTDGWPSQNNLDGG